MRTIALAHQGRGDAWPQQRVSPIHVDVQIVELHVVRIGPCDIHTGTRQLPILTLHGILLDYVHNNLRGGGTNSNQLASTAPAYMNRRFAQLPPCSLTAPAPSWPLLPSPLLSHHSQPKWNQCALHCTRTLLYLACSHLKKDGTPCNSSRQQSGKRKALHSSQHPMATGRVQAENPSTTPDRNATGHTHTHHHRRHCV